MRKEVSTIELLDMLDHSFVGTCQHRRTVARCKAAALQLLQHAIPGWLIINTDWAEKGWYPQRACCEASIGLRSPPAIHVSVGQYFSSEHWYDRHTLNKGSRVMTADGKEWVVDGQCAAEVSVVSPHEVNDKSPTTMLKEGDEVTTSTGSYGRVCGQVGTVVQVEIGGDVRQCARDTLHLRHWVTKAFFGLTNDGSSMPHLIKHCWHLS